MSYTVVECNLAMPNDTKKSAGRYKKNGEGAGLFVGEVYALLASLATPVCRRHSTRRRQRFQPPLSPSAPPPTSTAPARATPAKQAVRAFSPTACGRYLAHAVCRRQEVCRARRRRPR